MKPLSKALLAAYLITLAWLVLFKFSYDVYSVLLSYQARSLNLVPFAASSPGDIRGMIDNLVVFIPFGLLLSANFKQATRWRKLTFIFIFSLSAEVIQFALAIGTTDINDVIANTLGGLIGLTLYDVMKRYIDDKKLDQFIVVTGTALLILVMLLRVLVFRVKY